MKIIGIIAEYNPFHFGHKYQLNKIKELYPESIIILITNSYFTQRGDVSIINKWDKTMIALNNDIDLIVELPFLYATQSADIFAKGALKILNTLKIDTLIFGSESNNIEKLTSIANIQLNESSYQNLTKKYLKEGNNYPTALNKALSNITNIEIKEPNDLLGLSYIKEIIKNNYPITPITIKRIGSYHAKEIDSSIANATTIRYKITKKESITNLLPPKIEEYINKEITLNNYFPYLKYKIISEKDLSIYQTVDEGIENRIKKEILNATSWEDLVLKIKTKRYTYNKINRMLVHILVSFTKKEAKNDTIDYIRINGFNQKGKKYLNKIKKEINIPIIHNYKPNISQLLDLEQKVASIYYLPLNKNYIKKEYQKKPIIKNETKK